jgi:hypothetical protein
VAQGLAIGAGAALEIRQRGQQHPGCAEAALDGAVTQERLL